MFVFNDYSRAVTKLKTFPYPYVTLVHKSLPLPIEVNYERLLNPFMVAWYKYDFFIFLLL